MAGHYQENDVLRMALQRDRWEADALAEQSAAESEAYRKELRRIQTERERAQREAQAAAKRQREAELLIGLGSAISSGQFPLGGSSSPTLLDEPMSTGSGRYKQCFYRVAGDRVSVSVPKAEACRATRSFGSQTGYLTR